jgi:4-hydroxybenzoate polyprenyltransferase
MAFAVLRLLRPKQWTKGLLVFAAPLFTGRITEPAAIRACLIAFVGIALLSSAVYVLNDACDRERDRNHPIKKNRPLASGAVSMPVAAAVGIVCAVLGFGACATLGRGAIATVGVYAALQVGYNLALKHVAVADVFLLASGYVLRAALGAAAIHVGVSGWLFLCTGFLALLVGIGKRRSEFTLQAETGVTTREALAHYSREGLDAMLTIAAAAAAMSYGIYSLQSPTAHEHPGLVLSAVWVVYAIFRYVYLVIVKGEGGEPESLLLKDPHILISVILFLASAYLVLAGHMTVPILDSR